MEGNNLDVLKHRCLHTAMNETLKVLYRQYPEIEWDIIEKGIYKAMDLYIENKPHFICEHLRTNGDRCVDCGELKIEPKYNPAFCRACKHWTIIDAFGGEYCTKIERCVESPQREFKHPNCPYKD